MKRLFLVVAWLLVALPAHAAVTTGDTTMEGHGVNTLLLILGFMLLGTVSFGIGYGSAVVLRFFDAAATLKD